MPTLTIAHAQYWRGSVSGPPVGGPSARGGQLVWQAATMTAALLLLLLVD